jgi:hypothetical protein
VLAQQRVPAHDRALETLGIRVAVDEAHGQRVLQRDLRQLGGRGGDQ